MPIAFAPNSHQRPVFTINGVLAHRDTFGIVARAFLRSAGDVHSSYLPHGGYAPITRKVFSGFKALMARTRRKDRYIACLDSQRPSLRSFELHLAAAARDAENFVNARMVVNI
jgi:hypothetical protein